MFIAIKRISHRLIGVTLSSLLIILLSTRVILAVDLVSIRLPIPDVHASFAPYYIAIDQGYFAKYGLEVRLEPGTPELSPVKTVMQGIDTFGIVGGPEILMTARQKGMPVKGIFLMHKDANFVSIVTLKKSGVTTLSQLEGKKVGYYYGHASTDILNMLFKKKGISVQQVDIGFNYGPLITGAVDAAWAFRTTGGIALPARGIEISQINPADYGIVTQGHTIFVKDDTIASKADIVQRFLNAIHEAVEHSLLNEGDAINATVKRDAKFKVDIGKQQLAAINPTIKSSGAIGEFSAEAMAQAKEQLVGVDLLPSSFDPESVYTNRFIVWAR